METARKLLHFVKPDSNLPFRQDNEKQINRQRLINRLNYVNFQDGTVLVNFKHKRYFQNVTLEAKPQPCEDDTLHCYWVDTEDIEKKLKSSNFENLFIVDGHKLVVIEPTVVKVDATGITVRLPETGRELSYRKMRRHQCSGISVQLSQNSAVFTGTLADFNAVHFRVDLQAKPPQTFQWIDHESPVVVSFSDGKETYYSAICHIVKQSHGARERSFVLEPDGQHKPRFRTKAYRSTRQQLLPSPNVVFDHPLTDKIVDLKIVDISGTGFSVEESVENSVLVPGLVVPEAELNFGNSFATRCRVQVVFRKVIEEEDVVRCGLAILDMDVQDHVNLLSLLYQVHERNSYLNNRVDMDKLWQFFFETGFIYPKKYAFIKANKAKFRSLYEKLYTASPRIARHFIYQDKGSILGHMAMVRFYENAWLIHHHAASKVESNRAGLVVLNQIGRFINDSHRLHSIHLDYVFCYYRPDNKFPHRVFGGVARHLKDPQASSLDPMAYLHVQRDENAAPAEESEEWQLTPATHEDLRELSRFYENHSGGLMIDALDLHPNDSADEDIAREYAAIDFKRERHLLSLRKKGGHLLAVVTVVLSDVGLNMSDLTNCIKVFVLDQEELSKELLQPVLKQLVHKFEQEEMPVLLYPAAYADAQEIEYEKTYNLWVLSMNHTDEYFSYLDRLIKTVKH
ncbi:PilZ domain-containing protein [Geomonas sp. RF6]|uniref:PilZ domain-containing protein n=1 Tax=Geomonas sp. RF6 TaxID=2897342 RepID=UPI001E34B07D|nr:PilZ domain-containing protein [Geomonas sp. RF6]UFS70154.1 PilZ domain-containing protein [Geomonas sp. RF6]